VRVRLPLSVDIAQVENIFFLFLCARAT